MGRLIEHGLEPLKRPLAFVLDLLALGYVEHRPDDPHHAPSVHDDVALMKDDPLRPIPPDDPMLDTIRTTFTLGVVEHAPHLLAIARVYQLRERPGGDAFGFGAEAEERA